MHKNFSIYNWMNTDYKCLKIVHLFVTYSLLLSLMDVIVMPVNSYMWTMGIGTEDKYLTNLYQKIRNMEQSDCINCFLTKTEELMDWKHWSKIDNTGTVQTMQDRPLPSRSNNSTCVVSFFDQRFQSTKTPVFVRKHLSNHRFAADFLFSGKDLIKYLPWVLIPIIDVQILTDVTITSSITKNV